MNQRRNSRAALKSSRKIALEKQCPECGAGVGALCIGSRGSTRQAPHRSRFGNPGLAIASPQLRVVNSSEEPKANAIIEAAGIQAAQDIKETFMWAAERCESPIERILVAQFLHPHTGHNWDSRCDILIPLSGSIEHVQPPPVDGFYLWPQIKIGPYRVDFIFASVRFGREVSWAIIECDGHDFHERTRQQAQRDKARDRYLIGKGYRVLRYTGSEIYRDPDAVWDEIIKIVLGLCD